MRYTPTPTGGRELVWDTPFGTGHIEWDENNVKIRDEHTPRDPDKSRGLGDTVAKLTKAVGIKPCGGCAKRQAKLNNLVPYKQ